MELTKLSKQTTKTAKRLGRGHGSGRGKTAGRGTKGQKARGKVALRFEGGARAMVKRLPYLRGRGRNKIRIEPRESVNIEKLASFANGSVIDVDFLIKNKVVSSDALETGVKIIGNSALKNKLTIKVPLSKGAKSAVEKAGGVVEA